MIGIIEKLGRAGTSFLITLLAVLLTQLVRAPLYLFADGRLENAFKGTSFLSSLVSPLALAPIFSWYFVGAFFKIKNLESQMRELATYDSMTNLYNRGSCLLELENIIRRIQKVKSSLTVLYIDIDHFKNINDTHGHDAGDMVIKQFANYLRTSLRESDIIGRIGGKEFLVGLPYTDLEKGLAVAEKLRKGVEEELITADNATPIKMTISIGVSAYHSGEKANSTEILKKADIALYKAKNNGRNMVCVH